MVGDKKPFCVKGGECIGNVPTIEEINDFITNYLMSGNDYWADLTIDGEIHPLDISSVVGVNKCVCFARIAVKHDTESGYRLEVWSPSVIEAVVVSDSSGSWVWNYGAVIQTDDMGVIRYRVDIGTTSAKIQLKFWVVFGKAIV